MKRHETIVLFALVLLVAIATPAAALFRTGGPAAPVGKCFPAAKWGPASDGVRPCVKVDRVEEDGSFSFTVSDANGTVRYTSGVGAQDR